MVRGAWCVVRVVLLCCVVFLLFVLLWYVQVFITVGCDKRKYLVVRALQNWYLLLCSSISSLAGIT